MLKYLRCNKKVLYDNNKEEIIMASIYCLIQTYSRNMIHDYKTLNRKINELSQYGVLNLFILSISHSLHKNTEFKVKV